MLPQYHVNWATGDAVSCRKADCYDEHASTPEGARTIYENAMQEFLFPPKFKKAARRENERPSTHPVEYLRVRSSTR
jgi:hypothetical protein